MFVILLLSALVALSTPSWFTKNFIPTRSDLPASYAVWAQRGRNEKPKGQIFTNVHLWGVYEYGVIAAANLIDISTNSAVGHCASL